jgi:hypothetical protein
MYKSKGEIVSTLRGGGRRCVAVYAEVNSVEKECTAAVVEKSAQAISWEMLATKRGQPGM